MKCPKCYHAHCDGSTLGCAWCQCEHPVGCSCGGCVGTVAVVVDTRAVACGVTVLRKFTGTHAARRASEFIATLPEPESGRYGLDVSRPGDEE